jgi:hypothetical protein
MDSLTTTEAAAFLARERGIIVKADTVKHWCQRGLLEGATYGVVKGADNKPRAQWRIPRDSLLTLTPPQRGWRTGRKRKPISDA